MNTEIEAALREALGRPIQILAKRRIHGGDISEATRIVTSEGSFFAKCNTRISGMFEAEAMCLAALRTANTSLVIPEVVAVSSTFILLTFLEPGSRVKDFDERFGRGLAELHRATVDRFGFAADTFCGSTLQPNPWIPNWCEFYREHRLGHQLRLAEGSGQIDEADARVVRQLLDRLDEWLIDGEPSLIHGDLWSGNLHVSPQGQPAIVDPACYYAHREAELGMMKLMGGFSDRVYDAYGEAYPLDSEWRERNPLYALYHLLNHANLFGGGYIGQAMRIVRRYV